MAVKNTKISPQCLSKFAKKIGLRRGTQRYKCNDCNKKFQLKRRNKQLQKIIFNKYIYKRQTLQDPSKNIRTVFHGYRNKFLSMNLPIKYIIQE